MAPEQALIAEMRAPADQQFAIVLKPLSHPELGDIRIDENLFAIGRTEAPFAAYAPEIVADLSRRHARIFSEYGAVYIADLDSKNGTTVNGASVQQKITKLRDGDEICFGRALSYRVQLGVRAGMPAAPRRTAKLTSLTLSPENSDSGLQPIVITKFPFLISKADEAFSRYKEEHPHQVNYISRRHAHIFLRSGVPFVEDLGSTNGTFVAGNRLDEHAVTLKGGDVIAFGGHHFVYQVSLQMEEVELAPLDPTVTKLSAVAPSAAQNAVDVDKTTFVAAADSFLDIFCVDQAQQQDDEVNDEALDVSDDAGKGADKRRTRSKFAIFLSELTEAFTGSDQAAMSRAFRWGIAFVALLGMFGLALYVSGAPERELRDLVASGEYARAAAVAGQSLERDPDNAELKVLGTEALLKANLSKWLAMMKAREFDRAAGVLGDMKKLSNHNADVQSLLNELEWVGNLEKFVAARGGADAPIQAPADEERIKFLVKQWDDDSQSHQRAFAIISSYVPEFRDAYAEALSHVRKLSRLL